MLELELKQLLRYLAKEFVNGSFFPLCSPVAKYNTNFFGKKLAKLSRKGFVLF